MMQVGPGAPATTRSHDKVRLFLQLLTCSIQIAQIQHDQARRSHKRKPDFAFFRGSNSGSGLPIVALESFSFGLAVFVCHYTADDIKCKRIDD